MKKIFLGLSLLGASSFAVAQTRAFSHFDIGETVGTLGVGVELGTPLCDFVQIRTGFVYMPRFSVNSSFGVETGSGMPISQSGMDKVTEMMSKMTRMEVDDQVDMRLKPKYAQFKFLVDVMPFRHNKHWRATVGFFAGKSRIGEAVNATGDASTLLGVAMYNYFYVNSCRQESMFGDIEIGGITLPNVQLDAKYLAKGMMGMPLGRFADGCKAMLVPDEKGMVMAEMEVNKFRPYVGIGYETALSKDRCWRFSLDAGVMLWGGKPKVYIDNVYKIDADNVDPDNYKYDIVRPNADETDFVVDEPLSHVDLVSDLTDIKGKVGDMVKVVGRFKCYPNLSLTFSYRIK